MQYDKNNVFARILRGEIPAKKVYEDDYVLAFYDIFPKAPIHIIVIPKGEYISHEDFSRKASDAEVMAFTRAIGKIARQLELNKTGYRLLTNHGHHAHQEVQHYHVHLLGGRPLGPLLVG